MVFNYGCVYNCGRFCGYDLKKYIYKLKHKQMHINYLKITVRFYYCNTIKII
jgi:hypothetical protein